MKNRNRDIIGNSLLEHPSMGFEQNVMHSIQAPSGKQEHKLIGTSGFVFIGMIALLILSLAIMNPEGTGSLSSYLPDLQFDLPSMRLSKVAMMSVGIFCIFVYFQIFLNSRIRRAGH